MIDLIVAEGLKMRGAPFVRGLLFFFLTLPLLFVVLFGGYAYARGRHALLETTSPSPQALALARAGRFADRPATAQFGAAAYLPSS